MPVNSREKGKVGERKAAEYLRSLGFHDAKRTVQYNGLGRGDVECPETLPGVHFEVKFGVGGFDLGTAHLAAALKQAERDAPVGSRWCVLWKPKGSRQWRLTVPLGHHRRSFATFADDGDIAHRLQVLR